MKFWSLLLIWVLFTPTILWAATQDFTIKTNIVNDITPPTTPALVSAIPIAFDQIDVTWTTATDNYLLGGYVVSRDGVPVATTTLTSFNDTGLAASTTYAYSVVAFDYFNNLSAVSNSLATTTFAAPVVATTTPEVGSQSATKTVVIKNFEATTTTESVTFTWDTNLATRYVLRWGRTDLYDGGYIQNGTYKTAHETTITTLEPGTTYQFEILAYSPSGVAATIFKGTVTTTSLPDEEEVPNVARLQVVADGTDVLLSYELPTTLPVRAIRIVRNHLGYPRDSTDGAVVYEGLATNFVDREGLATHRTQYYSIFVIAESGTISSGAVGTVSTGEVATQPDLPTATSSASTSLPEVPLLGLDSAAIKLYQLGREYSFMDTEIDLSYKDSFTIKIAATALPKHLKTIIVTLLDPTNQRQSYSFLLRLNKDQTAYEATVAPLYVRGVSRLQIEVYDYDQMVVGRYRKQVDFVVPTNVTDTEVVFPDALVSSLKNDWWLGILLLLFGFLVFLLMLMRRSRKAEDNS